MTTAQTDAASALLRALKLADDCKASDPMLRVCHTCWDKLLQSADALAQALEPDAQPTWKMG